MTHVELMSDKMIDRAIRYIMLLSKKDGLELSYEEAYNFLCEGAINKHPTESVVLKGVNCALNAS